MSRRIKYKDLKTGKYNLKQLRSFLIENMHYEEFLYESKKEIVSAALRYFNFSIRSDSKEDIEKYCIKVLECIKDELLYIDIYKKPIHKFFSIVLFLHCKPIKYKCEIESQVKSDLWKIEQLLKRYREHDFIIEFENNPFTPRNHLQKTEITFFQRAIKKYQEISDYLIKDLDIRAINKALDRRPEDIEPMFQDLIERKDIPYYELIYKKDFIYDIDFEKLDSKKINLLKNKWYWLDYSVSYKYDKKTLNKIINKVNSKKLIKELSKTVNSIPTLNERRPVFKELKSLFESKKYYGFYALAIPQIEGLFADMIKLLEPNSNKLSKSLVEKINHISNFYESSDFYFDYYMYFLPFQRNKFSHAGKDVNIKGKSNQILFDLLHIVIIYSQLDSPINKLNNIINKEAIHFSHIGDYSNFLIQHSKSKKLAGFNSIKKKTDKFSKMIFANGSRIQGFLQLLFNDFESSYSKFNKYLQDFSDNPEKVDIENQQMKDIVKNIEYFQKELSDKSSLLFGEDFKVLADTITLVNIYPKAMKGINKSIEDEIKSFKASNKLKVAIIHYLNSKLNIDIPDYFSLKKNELQHITLDMT